MKVCARDDIHVFNCKYQNRPGNPEDVIFADLIDKPYYQEMPHDMVFYGAVDPPVDKLGKGTDPSAILISGHQRSTGTLYVTEARIKERVPSLVIQEMIELQKRYKCKQWVIETIQFQEFFKDELVKESGKQGAHVPTRSVKSTTEKNMRIESIQSYFTNGFIKLLSEQRVLIGQLRESPDAGCDDSPDALQIL